MLKSKSMILFAIMILSVCFWTALDNKKADTIIKENVDTNIIDLQK